MMNPSPSPLTLTYGPAPCQAGELYLPEQPDPTVVCLLHGGLWRTPYGRDQMVPLARDLQRRGHAVWNLGYRRVGDPGGGWPGTFDDVSAGLKRLADAVAAGIALDLSRLIVAGHSAGAHLALCYASSPASRHLPPRAIAGLAPVTDLTRYHEQASAQGVIELLLGGRPGEQPVRYRAASPLCLLPLGLPQLIIHGSEDEAVPIESSRDYVRRAREAGDEIRLAEIAGMDHMSFLDPASPSHAVLCDWIAAMG